MALGDGSSRIPIRKKRPQSTSWLGRQKSNNPFLAQEKKLADLMHEFDDEPASEVKESKKAKGETICLRV